MDSYPQRTRALVASGETVSSAFAIIGARSALTVAIPAITSCEIYLQVAVADPTSRTTTVPTSAEFGRMHTVSGSAPTFAVAAGPAVIGAPVEALAATHARVEFSVAQNSIEVVASIR